MSSALRLDSAWLAGLAVESVLYGMFVVLFTDTIRVLVGRIRQRKDTTTALLLVTGLILFMCMTAHWAIDLSRAFDAFIYSQDSSQSSPLQAGQTPADLFYSYTATKKYVATSGLYVVIKATGDAFMIYRLYVVWNRSIWIVAFPALIEVTLIVTGSMTAWELSRPHGTVFDINRAWITAFFASSFVVTGFCAS
ncbi:hypothetical protein EW026_g1392 [Hermanssonia centrifuga]|uniref:Uncharacterized protein n=1 Tax=Hermanssonia centrifuga TaxID=98765 RepID=A0A4S4KRM8_9APHY|nr:hypothetical protein EW026_g1392 [Hermanssonia centrifuga]